MKRAHAQLQKILGVNKKAEKKKKPEDEAPAVPEKNAKGVLRWVIPEKHALSRNSIDIIPPPAVCGSTDIHPENDFIRNFLEDIPIVKTVVEQRYMRGKCAACDTRNADLLKPDCLADTPTPPHGRFLP